MLNTFNESIELLRAGCNTEIIKRVLMLAPSNQTNPIFRATTILDSVLKAQVTLNHEDEQIRQRYHIVLPRRLLET